MGTWQVILEGQAPPLPQDLVLLYEDVIETGRRLFLLQGKLESLEKWLAGLSREELISWGPSRGEWLRLPSGLILAVPGASLSGEVIYLRSQGAFGSGLHPTTKLCLELIDEILKKENFSLALDLGAGSGVLSLVAAKRKTPTVALEIDPSAVKVCQDNVLLNSLEGRVFPVCGDLAALKGPFDLILANLYLRILIPLAPEIKRLLSPQGLLVLSGFLEPALAQIRRAYHEFEPWRIKTEGAWVAVALRRPIP